MVVVKVTGNRSRLTYWSKIPRFLARQMQQVRAGGWKAFWRKIITLLSFLPPLLPLPMVLLIRLLRPFIIIRFGRLISTRIGHLAANTEVYLCERDAGINVPRQPFMDIWYHMPLAICNEQLKKMWDRTLYVWPAALVEPVDRLSRRLPGGKAHRIPLRDDQDRDINGVLKLVQPHLTFRPEEEEKGQAGLRGLGVPKGALFVCFHARDSVYLKNIYPNLDTSYHNYRDSNIHNYLPAVEELTRRGYYAIRMGAVVKEKLKFSNDRIIDYASDGERSAFMDIYLGAKCCFYFGNPDGLFCVPMIFRRPAAMIDAAPLDYIISWGADNLTIPKKYWLRYERRFMTFRKILDSGAGRFLETQQFEQFGIELIENTPKEIVALAIEMDERLKGMWQTSEEDEELQRRFWALFKPSKLHGNFVSRIGAEFLRQHRDWLE